MIEETCVCGRPKVGGRCPGASSPSHPIRVAMLEETMVEVAALVDERRGTSVGWAAYSDSTKNWGVAPD